MLTPINAPETPLNDYESPHYWDRGNHAKTQSFDCHDVARGIGEHW
jgi:hypothetical protein